MNDNNRNEDKNKNKDQKQPGNTTTIKKEDTENAQDEKTDAIEKDAKDW